MRQNRKILRICFAILAVCLAGMLLLTLWPSNGSRYSRNVEENFFSLGMEQLNGTIAEPYALEKGDAIVVNVVRISGELAISIGQENREPIYEGRNPELGGFQVTVPEDGTYFLSVSGKHAEGSISFQINRAARSPVLRNVD